jgi:OOP family OmpA-OmpF porin
MWQRSELMSVSSQDAQKDNAGYASDSLMQIRSILVGPEQQEITRLKERLDNPELRAEELSGVLAEAILIRASRDKNLALALLPTVEEIIKDSVRRDPGFLASAIFPVIGPAIRKAISESFRSMVQSLNEALEQSLSWKGLRWRWESFKTGIPFSEIVLIHTLVYRVEQVFLIHKPTGLVLQHTAIDNVIIQDKDVIAGMLTAIQDFVKDSFSVAQVQALQSLNVGDLTIWIEQGTYSVLAAVIRGQPPHDLHIKLEEAIEKIEFEQRQALLVFQGDATPFVTARPHLESCLLQARGSDKNATIKLPREEIPEKKSHGFRPEIMIVIAGVLCLAIIIIGFIWSLR